VFRSPTFVPLGGELYPWRCWRQAKRAVPVSGTLRVSSSRDGLSPAASNRVTSSAITPAEAAHLGKFMARDRVHVVAMTGSYFRGDAEAVLAPQDESKFDTVTYTYYEQLNGYEYLKQLDIGYFFYSGSYADDILNVLDSAEKTIVRIPSVNSRESTKDKIKEVEHIIGALGEWQGTAPATGFQLVKTPEGRMLRIADLVDDDPAKRDRVSEALKDPEQKNNRDHVDIIIALGMAKEGFDWIWCDHALTVGYRSSLTEIVQIIGRATRDAPGKTRARFTNLIAEPDASEAAVTEAVNDTLKAIAASLLMEQVLAPRFEFKPKNLGSGPTPGFDYGEGGYDSSKCNVGFNEETGRFQIEIKGLAEPKSKEAARICQEDLNEVIAAFVQDKIAIERGLFDEELVPEELTQVRMGKIIKDKYPELDDEDQEAVRQHAITALNLTQQAKQVALGGGVGDTEPSANTALIDGVRRFAMDVRELDIDLIDRINPFGEAYAILAKTMSEDSLKQVAAAIAAKRTSPSFVREPQDNGVAERFIRTLKENLLWVRTFDTIEELRAGLVDFASHYNETWLVARHGNRTPAQVRADQCRLDQNATADLKFAA
jgi:hypothetical protein